MEDTSIRLKKALNLRNMKQKDLVDKTGIGKSAISQYLSGKVVPKQDKIYLIAKALNVNEAWLMGYDVVMDKESSKFNILEKSNLASESLEIAKAYEKASEKDKRTIKLILDIQVKEVANNQKQVVKHKEDEEIEKEVNRYRQQLIAEKKRELCNSIDLEEQEGKAN